MNWLLVALGSALGGVMRYGLVRLWPLSPGAWPAATLGANLAGCFLIGALYVKLATRAPDAEGWRLFWMTGVLGGFTTFSAFALEANLLHASGVTMKAISYVLLSVAACLIAAAAGRAIAQAL